MSTPEHSIQFWENDAFFIDSVSAFISAGLRAGDACIVLATKPHTESLEDRLQKDGLDVAAARLGGQYFSLDAATVLSKFMVDGLPEPKRFAEIVGSMIARAAKRRNRVRIVGEMVTLLWSEGNKEATIRLEQLWNELGKTHAFSLLCTYPIHSFGAEMHGLEFDEICRQHSRVIPAESFNALTNPDERLRAIALLQQKASSLDSEISERKQAQEALFHLAAIVESSDDAILSKNLEGIITSWNAAAERMYGYRAAEIVGRSVTLLFPPDQQDEFTQIMARIRRGERVDHFETVRRRKDGTYMTVSVTVSPIKDSTGHIIGASDITRDITERKRLEEKVQQLFDSTLIGVFVSDFAGTFLDANDTFFDLLGYTRAELLAGSIQRDALTPPEFHHLSQNALQALHETGASGTYEKEYLHKSGRRIPVLVAVTRIDQTDTCIGFVLDISERKELDQRKDAFISMASHELKTPVTSLKGFLSLLQRRISIQEDEKALHYLARMDTQVNKLIKLIGNLLDLSKMQTGQPDYDEERFEVGALVQEIVENVQGTAQTHRLLLDRHTQAEVFGDRDRVGQVLINLLNNAIKYSPQADTVLIRVAKDQKQILVCIQDFGIGIARDYQQKIFQRFYQVTDHEVKSYPGLGIGLYICDEIIKRHGGRLWVESQKGEGASFYFTLPLIQEDKRQASFEHGYVEEESQYAKQTEKNPCD
jgi:PAS domain S-box-containing protein